MSGALTALLQLASPALPVGAYSYSQGLESAIDAGLVRDEPSAARWIGDALRLVLARFEAPLWLRLYRALRDGDQPQLRQWNERFVASRESSELRAETLQMGYSLIQLLRKLQIEPALEDQDIAYPCAHAMACRAWQIDETEGLTAYLYGWAENQVTAALKAIPLGQTAGQRLLLGLRADIERAARHAATLEDDELSSQAPMLAILSACHETQYSRLFRS